MMQLIKNWFLGRSSINESLEETDGQEIQDAQILIRESRAKNLEADARLNDYQERIRRETRKRLAIASGGKIKDG